MLNSINTLSRYFLWPKKSQPQHRLNLSGSCFQGQTSIRLGGRASLFFFYLWLNAGILCVGLWVAKRRGGWGKQERCMWVWNSQKGAFFPSLPFLTWALVASCLLPCKWKNNIDFCHSLLLFSLHPCQIRYGALTVDLLTLLSMRPHVRECLCWCLYFLAVFDP